MPPCLCRGISSVGRDAAKLGGSVVIPDGDCPVVRFVMGYGFDFGRSKRRVESVHGGDLGIDINQSGDDGIKRECVGRDSFCRHLLRIGAAGFTVPVGYPASHGGSEHCLSGREPVAVWVFEHWDGDDAYID